jgi:hypothetical protein
LAIPVEAGWRWPHLLSRPESEEVSVSVIEAPRPTEAEPEVADLPSVDEPELPSLDLPPDQEMPEEYDAYLARTADVLEEYDWCQHQYAEDGWGQEVDATAEEAVRFCAVGAMTRVLYEYGYEQYDEFTERCLNLFSRVLGVTGHRYGSLSGVPAWNDRPEQTKENVVRKIREAALACSR